MDGSTRTYWTLLAALLSFKVIASICFIIFSGINLSPDEAQYWVWGKLIDWGYYSKSPGIAWQILGGCSLFGDSELGVRIGAVLVSVLSVFPMIILARFSGCTVHETFWAAVVLVFSPIGIVASFAAVTDGGLVFFWICAVIVIVSGLSRERCPNYLLFGLVIACGALIKWPQIYFLWGMILIYWFWVPSLRSWRIVGGMAISLFGLIPSMIWNMHHDWANIKHIYYQIVWGSSGRGFHGNFAEFFGAQVGLISPILFFLLLIALGFLVWNGWNTPLPLHFCGWTCLSLLIFAMVRSLIGKVQANWFIFAYPTGIVFMCWYLFRQRPLWRPLLSIGIALSVVLSTFLLAVPALQAGGVPLPYSLNAFQQSMGWDRLAEQLQEVGYDEEEHFLFADTYQLTSILSFYGPTQERAYFLNLRGKRKNQFSFWPSLADEQLGRSGYFVFVDNGKDCRIDSELRRQEIEAQLTPYFDAITFRGLAPLFQVRNIIVKRAFFFFCEHYTGDLPPEVERW